MNPNRTAQIIARGMRFHQGLGRGGFGFLGDGTQTYDPSQLPYLPTPTLAPVGSSGAVVPVSPQVSNAVVQSSTWPTWGTYAAIGAGVLALIWLAGRNR